MSVIEHIVRLAKYLMALWIHSEACLASIQVNIKQMSLIDIIFGENKDFSILMEIILN